MSPFELLNPFLDFFGYFEIKKLLQQVLIYQFKEAAPISLNFGISPVGIRDKTFFISSFHLSYFFWAKVVTLGLFIVILKGLAKLKFRKFVSFNYAYAHRISRKKSAPVVSFALAFKPILLGYKHKPTKLSIKYFAQLSAFETMQTALFVKPRVLVAVLCLVILSCFFDVELSSHYLPPILLLFLLPLFTRYMTYQDEIGMGSVMRATPMGYYCSLLIRWLVVCFVIVLLFLPFLLKNNFSIEVLKVLIIILLISLVSSGLSVVSVRLMRSSKLFEIFYIIVNLVAIWLKP